MKQSIFIPIPMEDFWTRLSNIVDECLSKRTVNTSVSGLGLPPGMTNKPLLTMKEVCELFNITKPTVYEWTRHGKLRPLKIRKRVYFLLSDLQSLMLQQPVATDGL